MQTEAVLKSKERTLKKITFSNLFLYISTSQLCVQISILIVPFYMDGQTSSNKLKKNSVSKVVLTFHRLNELFQKSQNAFKFLAFSLEVCLDHQNNFLVIVGQNNFQTKYQIFTNTNLLYVHRQLHQISFRSTMLKQSSFLQYNTANHKIYQDCINTNLQSVIYFLCKAVQLYASATEILAFY